MTDTYTTDRKLATIRKIAEIKAIPDADRIVAYRVDGWWVVDSVGKYTVGDLAVYVEVDSWIPTTLAPFLSKGKEPREFNGVKGEKLRTIRLRKQISQGLLLPLEPTCSMNEALLFEGLDVSAPLGIIKYEAPVPACLAGLIRGNFPSFIPKTDQERVQNLSTELEAWRRLNLTWTVSEKMEGSSFTAFFNNGDFGICSRNLDLKPDPNNTLWATAATYDLQNKLSQLGRNIAVQAELLGPGVQGNIYKLTKHMLTVFDIFDIDRQQYMSPAECVEMTKYLGLTSVPVMTSKFVLGTESMDDLIKHADGSSVMGTIGCPREGLVYKCNEFRTSFKTVSNAYLLKSGE